MSRWLTVISCGAIALAIAGCSGKKDKNDNGSQLKADSCFVIPDVPDTVPDERKTSFIIRHFWDNYDPSRTEQTRDTVFMEQSFSNFIAIVPYGSRDDAGTAVVSLLKRAVADETALRLLEDIAGEYLNNPNSPMRSEDIYILFLEEFSTNRAMPEDIRERSAYRLAQAMKNRPGTKSADFPVVMSDGRTTTLLKALTDTTAVMFYDPDCELCSDMKKRLTEHPELLRFQILAVDVKGDRKRWNAEKGSLPQGWKGAFALTDIEDAGLYRLPALPSFYLLAPDGTVLVKDFVP